MSSNNKHNRIESSEVIRALELRLNQVGLPKSNKLFFDCPDCHKPQSEDKFNLFNITHDNLGFRCFICGFSGNIFTLAKYLNLFDNKDYSYFNDDTKKTKNTEIHTPKINKDIDFKEVSRILTDLYNNTQQSNEHKTRFYNKRGFNMPTDYKSLSGFKDIKFLYDKYDNDLLNELFRNSKGNFKQLRDKVIIFHRDFNNDIVYYRLYNFSSKDNKYKKLSSKNINGVSWSIPFRLELITPLTDHLIIVEGEEKADVSNIYRSSNQAFISIPGITQQRTLNKIIDKINTNETDIKQITVILDKSLKKSLNEEKASINIIDYLSKNLDKSIVLNISELPSPDKSDKNDLDSFLKELPEAAKKDTLQNIINNSYSVREYRQKYNLIREDKRERIKHVWKDTKEVLNEYITKEQTQKELTKKLNNYVVSNSIKLFLAVILPGYGKTTITTEVIKNFHDINKPCVVALPTKKQRNEYALINNFQIIESFTDRIDNLINTDSRFNDTERKEHKEKISKLLSLGLPKAVYSYLGKNDMNLKAQIIDKSKVAVITHDYLISHKELMQDYELLYIDEDPTRKLIKTVKVDYKNFTDYKTYSENTTKELDKEDNEDLLNFIFILKEYIATSARDLERKALNNDLSEFFRAKKQCFNKIIDKLLNQNIRLNENLIMKNIHKDFNNIPGIDFMNDLIRAFKENRVYFSHKEFNQSFFEIKIKLKINTYNKKVILTDGTAQEDLIKHFFDIETVYKPTVKPDNIKFTLIADKRYSASYLDIDDTAKKLNEIAGNDDTLVIAPKSITEDLKDKVKSNITLINFNGSENKASNEYCLYKKAVCLMPKIDYQELNKVGLCLDPSITDNDFIYQDVSTGYTENNKEHHLNLKTFKHETSKAVLKNIREAEILQSLFRVKRNDDFKEFYLMGDVSLKEFNLIPDILITENIKKTEDKIIHKSDFELLKNLFNQSINNIGFFVPSCTDFKGINKAVTIVNIEKHNGSNNIYNNIADNVFFNNCNTYEGFNVHRNTLNNYLKMLVKNGDYKVLPLPILNNPKHKIYCLTGQEDQAIIKAREYFKDILLSENMKKTYQNTSLNDNSIIEGVNIPSDNLTPENSLLNDNLNDDIKSKDTQEDKKENIISEIGPTLTPEKQQDTISYADYVRLNIDNLNKFVDRYLDNRIEFKMILDSTCFNSLEGNYNEALELGRVETAYSYEYLINKIIDNFEAYNEYIKDTIEAQQTHIKVLEIKDNHDRELKANLLKLGSNNQTIKKHLNSNEYNKYNSIPIHDKELFLDDLVKGTSKEVIEGKKILYNLIEKLRDKNKERTIRKYISMLIIKNQKLNSTYFNYVNKWVLDAPDIEEFIRRQDLRDFVFKYQHYINVLIS